MNPFYRNKDLITPQTYSLAVPIDPALSREQQVNQWLDSLAPRFCGRHKRTQLVLHREASKDRILARENHSHWFHRYMTPGVLDVPDRDEREKLYLFEAIYHCPACRLQFALCPPEFHQSSFVDFDQSTPERAAALAIARKFAKQVNERNCGFMLFVGLPGTGKTHLACNIVRELTSADALYSRSRMRWNLSAASPIL